jgi:Na+/H+ antiporter NhaC
MKRAEERVKADDFEYAEDEEETESKGTVMDLILPMVVLIFASIICMAYTGGFFEGVDFTTAIGENPTMGLVLGAFVALMVCMVLYIPRKLLTFREFMEGSVEGVKTMVGAILILVFAWALSGVCRELIGTGEFVSNLVASSSFSFALLPVIVFVVAAFLSFSMGTAWGTFGILIPIVTMICASGEGASVLICTLGATLAGSVYGDHCSPISDTTILSSAGAKCDHIAHVQTQIPYATLVAGVCVVGYLVGGITTNPWITLIVSECLLVAVLVFMSKRDQKKTK